MELSAAAKVGMLTVVAFILLGLVFFEIGKLGPDSGTRYHVVFDDVQGLQVRSAVNLAGVRIGYVADIQLNKQNRVDVSVQVTREDVKLYSSDYFTYTIASSILGDKWLEIKPGNIPEGVDPITGDSFVVGTTPISLDELAKEGSELVEEMQGAVAALNDIVGDDQFKNDVKVTVTNIREVSGNLKDASKDARTLISTLQERMKVVAVTMEQVVERTSETVAQLKADAGVIGSHLKNTTANVDTLVQNNVGNLNAIVGNLRDMSASLKNTAGALESLADDPKMREDVVAIAENIRKVSEEVAGIASDVRKITGDEQVQSDIKETVSNVREASGSIKRITNKAEKTVDDITGGEGLGGRKLFGADVSEEWKLKDGKLSTNANVWLFPNGGPLTVRLGLDSIGDENLLNLQAGKTWENWRLRGGIVRSKVGVGADAWLFDKRFEANLDVYDPRDIKVDVLGKIILPKDWYVYGGVRDVTDKHHSSAVVGAGKRF
ncbi:MCE family protein [bacterium]|nr:MCE family protein [bacterium]